MKTTINESDFEVMVAQTGLPLTDEQKRTLLEAYPHAARQ